MTYTSSRPRSGRRFPVPIGRTRSALLTLLAITFLTFTGAEAQTITAQQFDIPGASQTVLLGINDSGEMVGGYVDSSSSGHFFTYSDGLATTLDFSGLPYDPETILINNNGQLLLTAANGGFIYQDGQYSTIDMTGYTSVNGANVLIRINPIVGFNDNGQILALDSSSENIAYGVPTLYPGTTNTGQSFSAPFTEISCSDSQGAGDPAAINDSDEITGNCGLEGFIYSGGTFNYFTYPGAYFTNPVAINQPGNIAGIFAFASNPSQAFPFISDGSSFARILVPNPLPGLSAFATGINDSNQVVGWFFGSDGVAHGFITSPISSLPDQSSPQLGKLLGGCNCSGAAHVSNPIDVASGNMSEHMVDYTTAGQNPLTFTRYYNSMGSSSAGITTLASTLGVNWRSNYDRYLQLASSSVIAERADGQQLVFKLSGTTWKTDSDIDVTLKHSGSTWTLTDRDDTLETYAAISSKKATLQSIELRNGYTQSLLRDNSGDLVSVTDTYGRELAFTYAGGLLETVTTPDKTSLTFTYKKITGGSQLTSANYDTSPASNQTYHYDNPFVPFALTSITDENDKTFMQWTYDAFGRALSSQLAGGAEATSVAYNVDGTTTVTNALDVADTYGFTTLQGIPKVTAINRAAKGSVAAATETFGYDNNGYLTSQTDWNGNKTTYKNTLQGLPISIVEAAGTGVTRTTTIVYDKKWIRLPATIISPGLTTGLTYDGNGEILTRKLTDTTTTSGATRTWTNTWTTNHLLASVETPNGHTTKFGYDGSGALTSITDPLSHLTSITAHTGGGLPEIIVDPNDVTTTLTYSPRQWLTTSAISGTGGTFTTSFTYDAAGNLTKTTLPDNSYLSSAYDSAHRLIKVTDALGNYANYTLNALDDRTATNIYETGGTLTRKHSSTFDDLGRALVDTAGAGQTTTFSYDPNSDVLSITDGLGHKTRNTYDALNRLSTSTDANGGVTTTNYDTHDRIISVKDANGNTTSYVRDGFGDVIQQISPDSGKTVYQYDLDGNLTQTVDAAGVITNHTYDALDRILTTTYPSDSAENVTYTYDSTGHGSGIGRLTNVTDAAGTLSRSYDERGNLTSEKRVHGSVTLSTRYSYDGASRIASITYPSGSVVKYSRDAAGQVTMVATPSATVASAITHLPFGPVNSFTYGNGVTDTRTFDEDYRMTALKDAASGATSVQSLAYAYDVANNLKTITDSVRASNSQTIAYDALNRLKNATAADYGTFTYTYDKVGNRLTEGRASEAPTNNYSYVAGTNRLSGIKTAGVAAAAFTYTPTGNIVDFMGAGQPTVSLLYNKANRVGTIMENGNQVAQYTYDGFGQRLIKTFAGTPVTGILFAYGQDGGLLEETNISGAAKADYIYLDGAPLGDLAPSSQTLYYLHSDHLGTPQLATNSTKATEWRATYEPFGWGNAVEGNITQNLRLPGQYFDSETTSYHNGFRDYVAIIGRYGQTDPIGLGAGTNTYSYSDLSPLNNSDPSGLDCVSEGGETTCSRYGVYRVTFPTPHGWEDFDAYDDYYHSYTSPQDGISAGSDCPDAVFKALANQPTPGTSNPASPNGSSNDATPPGARLAMAAYAASGLGLGAGLEVYSSNISPVLSYTVTNQVTGNPVVVNVTLPGHPLFPGIVVRTVSQNSSGTLVNNYGEGNAIAQAPFSPAANDINNVWIAQTMSVVNGISRGSNCGCK